MESKELYRQLLKEARVSYEGKYLKCEKNVIIYISKLSRIRTKDKQVRKLIYTGLSVKIFYYGNGVGTAQISTERDEILTIYPETIEIVSQEAFLEHYNVALELINNF